MYGGDPFDMLSFEEDNIVGILEIWPWSGKPYTRFVQNLRFKCRERAL